MEEETVRTENPPGDTATNSAEKKPLAVVPLAEIEAAIRRTKHGVIQIIIQDGVVVQIDRTEKLRLR